jgi:hypothetical protein
MTKAPDADWWPIVFRNTIKGAVPWAWTLVHTPAGAYYASTTGTRYIVGPVASDLTKCKFDNLVDVRAYLLEEVAKHERRTRR